MLSLIFVAPLLNASFSRPFVHPSPVLPKSSSSSDFKRPKNNTPSDATRGQNRTWPSGVMHGSCWVQWMVLLPNGRAQNEQKQQSRQENQTGY
ncbi:hypothetical protein FJTKL_00357 [Diaporthe vaccinii]|uniref:Secreted protein n=1 Tax=Diaporthe vaccinii TaxID=105482 RepID=A0ABR4E3C7_9PEZI